MYTLADLAARARLSLPSIRRLCQAGIIPAQKVGRDWVIADLEAAVTAVNGRPQPGAPTSTGEWVGYRERKRKKK